MNPSEYFLSLTKEERETFATIAGTTLRHCQDIFRLKGGPKKTPRHTLIARLVLASKGKISIDDAIDHFHGNPIREIVKGIDKKD